MFPPRRLSPHLAAFIAGTAVLHAHPGHAGHELTWNLGHLAAHPFATLGWIAIIAGAALLASKFARRAPAANQSLRGSQRSRGK